MVPSEDNQLVPKEEMLWRCRQNIFDEMKKKFSQIENAADELRVLCIIQDTTNAKTVNERITLNLPASTPVKKLFEDIASKVGYVNGTFDLIWGNGVNVANTTPLDYLSDKSVVDAGFEPGKKNFLHLTDKDGEQPQVVLEESGGSDDHNPDRFIGPLPREGSVGCSSDYVSQNYSYSSILSKSETGYVGLVNQAMTCYLNSLLQTLYMTPEFRNALYRWEFEDSEEDPVTSIPYQLQRLFVLLQTSKKRAIETTDVTRSFGWDSSEAWQQHDVQELCRVMFDALEQKWKQTEQLVERTMIAFFTMLALYFNVGSIKQHPLDSSLISCAPVILQLEEALHAFIQPEILDGANQYFCERCKKKCDARKGLRFLHFPYLLTLQLKRFDFDYTTMHRIKLNDRMTFPEELDMGSFIDIEDEKSPQTESCTDSGAENEGSCHSDQMSNDFSNDDGIDEGICLENNSAAERISKVVSEKNSLLYELFSVMVHSGSAAGGHYYACIKSFSDDQWYSFNDQHVSKITHEDIKKTYGGSSGSRGYYSSAFASSTNAYMLIYRLKDTTRNAKFLEVNEYPEHIKQLVEKEKELEEQEKRQREIERNTCKIKLFCMHPVKQIMMENKLEVHKDKTLKEAVELAYKIMDLEEAVPLNCCRLVKYDEFHDYLERSYEGEDDTAMGILLGGVKSTYMFDLLLETRQPDQSFQCYKPGEVMVKVHVVDLKQDTVAPPISVRAYLNQTVTEFKYLISKAVHLPAETMRVVLERCYNDLRLLNVANKTLKAEGFFRSNKVFIESSDSQDRQLPFTDSQLWKLLDRHANTIRLYVSLPEQSPGLLFRRTIFQKASGDSGNLDANCEAGKGFLSNTKSVEAILEESTEKLKTLSLQQQQQEGDNGDSSRSTEASDFENIESPSNEADSSASTENQELENQIQVSDTDNFQSEERSDSDLNNDRSTSSVDSDILSSSHSSDTLCNVDNAAISLANGLDSHSITSSRRSKANEGKKETWDTAEEDSGTDSEYDESGKSRAEAQFMYFKAEPYIAEEGSGEGQKWLLIHVDKRITLSAFKQLLEPFVGVPSSQFKVFRIYASSQEFESVRLNETLSSFSDDNKITIRFGRALKKGEYRVKVYQLLVNDPEPCKFLIDSVFAKGMTVRQSKEELLPQLREQCGLNLTVDRYRLRKKTWKNPGTVFLDYHVYEEDINISSNWEVFLEILEEAEKMKSMSQLAVLSRRWRPSEMKLDPFQEVVLESSSVDELKEKLSAISGIVSENIEFAKGRGTFPCEISILEIHQDLDWNPKVSTLNVWPLYICDDGAVIFYRDKTEEMVELTEDQRNELMKKESSRLQKTGHRVTYSPRKEKALKIYLDGAPNKDLTQD
ncbi:ubiquitin carboxyl-terminal hydrolase 47 [Notechis scutatus]|uniref:Ubiquitin carboxyl-terminal hydrolase 47 n=1 Tax=Notechis scutatus TaxID=8663 RepID=A0A6J1TR36_9SAUR|nr:ubiquitin carboxyl-terminal hydrolase 47 [Notechis scutatus]